MKIPLNHKFGRLIIVFSEGLLGALPTLLSSIAGCTGKEKTSLLVGNGHLPIHLPK